MSILSILRNFNGDPNIVTIVTTNTLTEITTSGYLEQESILNDISILNNGPFEWQDTDMVLIYYSGGIGFFTHTASSFSFSVIAINPPPNTMYTSDSSGNVVFAPFQQNVSFNTVFTFEDPHDLTVVYNFRNGFYWRIGNRVSFKMNLNFTPTFTTSIGNALFVLPHIVARDLGGSITSAGGASLTYPAGTTFLIPQTLNGNSLATINAAGNGVNQSVLGVSNFTSGQTYNFSVAWEYIAIAI